MEFTRRQLLAAGAAGSIFVLGGDAKAADAASEERRGPGMGGRRGQRTVSIRVGAMDGILGAGGAKSLEAAKRAGLDGVEPDAGGPADVLRICKPETIQEYRKASEATGVTICSICMGLLNGAPFIKDKRAPGWVSGVIDAAAALKAKTILMAFFGDGELKGREQMDACASLVKDLAPKAAEKGVTLGLENTLKAEDDLYVLEKAGNPAGLKIYYDVGNATHYGYDVPAEIRLLKDRICQIHFKDYKSGILGKGEIKILAIADAIADIRYDGWIVLETGAPLGPEITAAANAAFVRGLFARWNRMSA